MILVISFWALFIITVFSRFEAFIDVRFAIEVYPSGPNESSA
jgi:hypothetical protein